VSMGTQKDQQIDVTGVGKVRYLTPVVVEVAFALGDRKKKRAKFAKHWQASAVSVPFALFLDARRTDDER